MASAVDNRHLNASPLAGDSKALVPTAEKTSVPCTPARSNQNPVAHEVRVIVAGARPCEVNGKRELFTEETSTVLVFENGGVIRFAAAVAAGQLLFLTNKETKCEVVAQVALKRDFKPTNCFVEVEFTEPAPGFWGIEFPELPPEYVLANPQKEKVSELVQGAKPVADKPSAPAHAHSAQEFAALKQQAETLREQLKLLQTQTAPENSTAPATPPDSPHSAAQGSVCVSVAADAPSKPLKKLSNAASEDLQKLPPAAGESSPKVSSAAGEVAPRLPRADSTLSASVAADAPLVFSSVPIDRADHSPSEENPLPKPLLDFKQARASAERSTKSKQTIATSGGSGAVRKSLLLAALLLAAAGVAWYQNLITGLPQLKNFFASAAPAAIRPVAARPAPATNAASPKPAEGRSDSAATTAATDVATSPPGATLPNNNSPDTTAQSAGQAASSQPNVAAEAAASKSGSASQETAKSATAKDAKTSLITASQLRARGDAVSAALREKSTAATSADKRSALRAASKEAADSVARASDDEAIVPPKLIKSVRAVAAPEALQDFATGDVRLDAIVDSSGQVKEMKVLSGPASLRNAALDALKEYRYEPATLHGNPVAAHVTVTIKFLFEP